MFIPVTLVTVMANKSITVESRLPEYQGVCISVGKLIVHHGALQSN